MRLTDSGLPRGLLAVNAALLSVALLGGLTFGRGASVLFAAAAFGAVVSVQEYSQRSRRRDRMLHREVSRLADGDSRLFGWTWERGRERNR